MSEYYTKNEMYGEKFYQIPKVLFTNPLYNDGLNDREKIAFGMLKDRFSLSKKNNWFDDEGRIYFIFSQENLMTIFQCSKQTASNIKKNLVKVGLLEIKKHGQGRADWLYLKKPIVTDGDIYLIDKEENLEPETLGALEKSKNKTSRSLKNRRQEVQKIDANNTDLNDTENNENEFIVNNELNKKDFINMADSFYSEMSPSRWSKKAWGIMTNKLIDELLERDTIYSVNDPLSYIEGCLKNICHKHDLKNGKVESDLDKFYDNLLGE